MVVVRDSGVPPYRQVADVLRMRIESGDLGPRRRLPSIAELAEEHGIARATAARAQQALVDEGLAEIVPGWGTYVLERR
jgi:DNA-binding GntR family transcriptional regulator